MLEGFKKCARDYHKAFNDEPVDTILISIIMTIGAGAVFVLMALPVLLFGWRAWVFSGLIIGVWYLIYKWGEDTNED